MWLWGHLHWCNWQHEWTQRSTRPLAVPSITISSGRAFNQPEKRIYSKGTRVLAKLYYTRRIIWEAIEIKLRENFKRESGYLLSPAWKIIHMVKQQRGCHEHTLPTNPVPDQGMATATAQGDSVPWLLQTQPSPPSRTTSFLKCRYTFLPYCSHQNIPLNNDDSPSTLHAAWPIVQMVKQR